MPVRHRHLAAAQLAVVACLCAGCVTLKQYPDAPPAQLDPAPPKPILTALPPVVAARGTKAVGRVANGAGRVESGSRRETRDPQRGTTGASSSSLADLIMGRTPPPAPPPLMPPQTFPSPGKSTPLDFQALEKAAHGTGAVSGVAGGRGAPNAEGRGSGGTQPATREAPPPNSGANRPAPATINHPPATIALPAFPRPPPLDTRLLSLDFRQIIALQTLLDRQHFSCNCADGKVGSRTHAALRAFQKARGLTVTGEPGAATLAALGDLGGGFTSYTVTADDHAQLTQNPTTWVGRAQAARLGYQTILEALAERGHATQQAIRDLNPQVTVWPDPPAGTTLTIPDVSSSVALAHAACLRISIGGKLVRVFDGAGQQLAQFPCSIARDPKKREPCEISVAVVAPNPNYTFDPALFSEDPESASITTRLIIPPGPRNPVGSAWVGLSKTGYGMHGTPKPEDIGKTESHGCFRLANWNAQKLLRMVEIGTPVSVEE